MQPERAVAASQFGVPQAYGQQQHRQAPRDPAQPEVQAGDGDAFERLSWLALIPRSRASRDTDAPGRPHAATSSALAASSYTLRPSLLRSTTSRRAKCSTSSDITFPRSPTWERSLSDGSSSLKDGVHCALTEVPIALGQTDRAICPAHQ